MIRVAFGFTVMAKFRSKSRNPQPVLLIPQVRVLLPQARAGYS